MTPQRNKEFWERYYALQKEHDAAVAELVAVVDKVNKLKHVLREMME